jgi:hypothetical protein
MRRPVSQARFRRGVCCIHFEDWKGTDAIRMLNRYADKVLCYKGALL